ncbi:hypothetical protein C8J57DRAFT_1531666 [Mycena rebaudengoi]|nr:hypothetical protein C8J57DRAFT_1531666 [Mycena rebaudengoi]
MPAERSSKKTVDAQGPYRRLRRLSSPDVPDLLLPAMLSPAAEHQQEVRRAEMNKEVANLGEIAAADPASDVKKQKYDDAVEDYVDQWGLFVPDDEHAKWLQKKTARRAKLFKLHHRVLDCAFGVDDPMIGDYCLLLELFEKDYRERFTIDEDEPHMSNVCGRYRAADGLARFCNGDTDKMYKITQKKMRYSFNNPFSDATRADAFVAKYRNLYRQILDANASLSDERVALRMNIFDACHAATGVLRFIVPGLEDRHDSLRYWAHREMWALELAAHMEQDIELATSPAPPPASIPPAHFYGKARRSLKTLPCLPRSPFDRKIRHHRRRTNQCGPVEDVAVANQLAAFYEWSNQNPSIVVAEGVESFTNQLSAFYEWSNQLSAFGNTSLGDGEVVESFTNQLPAFYEWSNQLSAFGNTSLGDGEVVESFAVTGRFRRNVNIRSRRM